jgi:alanine-glyoxylate transaminase/serine-glyoxylate transaminase/serine-pyruvate transaminase
LDWGVDVAFTASQKAIGAPPGLALGVVGQKALKILDKNPPLSFFSDLRKWQMVFKNILELKPGYFGTPNVNLITALNMSLMSILNEGLERRIERHRIIGESFRTAIDALGLEMIPKCAYANTLSVQYLPKNVKQSSFLAEADRYGAVFAGGLVPEIKDKYFRIGHMGSVTSSEVMISLSAIERALKKNGFDVKLGIGLTAAQEVLHKYDLENSS